MTIKAIQKWGRALLSAIITGACSAGLGSLGITSANVMGATIPPLNKDQLLAVWISGGVVGCMAYLSKSPLPTDDDDFKP